MLDKSSVGPSCGTQDVSFSQMDQLGCKQSNQFSSGCMGLTEAVFPQCQLSPFSSLAAVGEHIASLAIPKSMALLRSSKIRFVYFRRRCKGCSSPLVVKSLSPRAAPSLKAITEDGAGVPASGPLSCAPPSGLATSSAGQSAGHDAAPAPSPIPSPGQAADVSVMPLVEDVVGTSVPPFVSPLVEDVVGTPMSPSSAEADPTSAVWVDFISMVRQCTNRILPLPATSKRGSKSVLPGVMPR